MNQSKLPRLSMLLAILALATACAPWPGSKPEPTHDASSAYPESPPTEAGAPARPSSEAYPYPGADAYPEPAAHALPTPRLRGTDLRIVLPRLEQRGPAAPASPADPDDGTGPVAPSVPPPGDPAPVPQVSARPDCPGLALRQGQNLAIDGQAFVFFGVNVRYLMDDRFPEREVEPILAQLADRGVNTVRVWFFHDEDPERFSRLLDMGGRQGIRFVVTMADNVHQGVDWFYGEEDEEDFRPHLERTVTRFKDRPEILLWEPVNEPNCGDGRYDDACLDTLRSWLNSRAKDIKAIDGCRAVSTSVIGAGNFDNEHDHFKKLHGKDAIEIVSAHRRSTGDADDELDVAERVEKPIFYGEVYDEAYDEGCKALGGNRSTEARAERIKSDLRDAIAAGVDGYLLWDLAVGGMTHTNGDRHDYCSKFGFEMGDPVWDKLKRAEEGLPPVVPWGP